MRRLPACVEEIAEAIGRERALFLIGQLPVCTITDRSKGGETRARRVVMYVPKTLKPDHQLVAILGWGDAQRLVDAFGGEIMCPPLMRDVIYRPFRDAAITRMHADGVTIPALAEMFEMSDRRVRQVLEIPKEGAPLAANDNSRISDLRKREAA